MATPLALKPDDKAKEVPKPLTPEHLAMIKSQATEVVEPPNESQIAFEKAVRMHDPKLKEYKDCFVTYVDGVLEPKASRQTTPGKARAVVNGLHPPYLDPVRYWVGEIGTAPEVSVEYSVPITGSDGVITQSFVINDRNVMLTVKQAKDQLLSLGAESQSKLSDELTIFVGDNEIVECNRFGELKSTSSFPPPYRVWLSQGPTVTYPNHQPPLYVIGKPVPMRGFGNGSFGVLTFETDLMELCRIVPQKIKISDIVVYTNSIHNLFRPPSYPHVMVYLLSQSQPSNVTLSDPPHTK